MKNRPNIFILWKHWGGGFGCLALRLIGKKLLEMKTVKKIDLPLYSFDHHSYKFNHENHTVKATVKK